MLSKQNLTANKIFNMSKCKTMNELDEFKPVFNDTNAKTMGEGFSWGIDYGNWMIETAFYKIKRFTLKLQKK